MSCFFFLLSFFLSVSIGSLLVFLFMGLLPVVVNFVLIFPGTMLFFSSSSFLITSFYLQHDIIVVLYHFVRVLVVTFLIVRRQKFHY